MLHKVLLWPEQFDTRLLAFTIGYPAYLWNHLPNERIGIAPIEIYTATKLDLSCLKNEHT